MGAVGPKCCPVKMKGQQNTSNVAVDVSPPQQNDSGGEQNETDLLGVSKRRPRSNVLKRHLRPNHIS